MPLKGGLLNYSYFVELEENSLPDFKGVHLHKVQAVDELEAVLELNPEEIK